jgi:hypothetical protein
MLEEALIHSDQQGLTEAWLAEEFGWDKPAPPPPGRGQQRETIAWFMDRQVRRMIQCVCSTAVLCVCICIYLAGRSSARPLPGSWTARCDRRTITFKNISVCLLRMCVYQDVCMRCMIAWFTDRQVQHEDQAIVVGLLLGHVWLRELACAG